MFGFPAEQSPGAFGLFAQVNALPLERLIEVQRRADGQIPWLRIHVLHGAECNGVGNPQAVDELRKGFSWGLLQACGGCDRSAVGEKDRSHGGVMRQPAEQPFRIAAVFLDRWSHGRGGVVAEGLGGDEPFDVLGVVGIEVTGLIPDESDHRDLDTSLPQFLQQPIAEAG